jgi:hypothetical protein
LKLVSYEDITLADRHLGMFLQKKNCLNFECAMYFILNLDSCWFLAISCLVPPPWKSKVGDSISEHIIVSSPSTFELRRHKKNGMAEISQDRNQPLITFEIFYVVFFEKRLSHFSYLVYWADKSCIYEIGPRWFVQYHSVLNLNSKINFNIEEC